MAGCALSALWRASCSAALAAAARASSRLARRRRRRVLGNDEGAGGGGKEAGRIAVGGVEIVLDVESLLEGGFVHFQYGLRS